MGQNTDTTDKAVNLADLGRIEGANVFGHIERLPGEFGSHAEHLLQAVEALSASKSLLDSTEAGLDLTLRKSAEISGEKVTEKKIKSGIEATQQWQQARAAVDAAEGLVERHKLALKTLDKKDRMLELLARAQIREYGAQARNS